MLSKQCKLHLEEVKMTGREHFVHAISIIWRLKKVEMALLVHSIAPRYFKTYATETMQKIINEQPKITK